MTKNEFLSTLRIKLQGLPPADIDERVNFYEEMIDDRVDEGELEENVIEEIGDVDDIVMEIAKDTPLVKLVKEKIKPKRKIKTWEIILLVLGFPLWFPLALTALVIIFVFCILIWVLVIVTYAIEIALAASSVAGAIAFAAYFVHGEMNFSALGISIMCAGAALLMIFACIAATKGSVKLSKRILTGIKMLFIGKRRK